ncbi:MAG TPA: ABC transporter permease [Candidatus Nanoarchaeia archaeon]|nr:ABC transporter permease [Candidatus Nanoarchaeia archaeon]
MIKDFFLLSLRSLRRRRLRSWLTMLGIFIGIAAVVSLVSLGQGLEDVVIGQFSRVGGDKLVIQNSQSGFGPPGSLSVTDLTDHDIDVVGKVKGTDVVVGRLFKVIAISFDDVTKFRFVASFPDDPEEARILNEMFGIKIADGRHLKKGDNLKAVIGYEFYSKEVFPRRLVAGDKLMVKDKVVEVVGVMDKTGNPQFDGAILMPYEAMTEILETGKIYSAIVASVQKGFDVESVAEDLKKAFRKDRNLKEGKEDFEIQTPKQIVETFGNVLNIVQAVVVGIAAISLIVGGIGIMNTMYTAVLERTREIGIMKSVGARNSHIFLLFLIESGMLGAVGGIIGVLLGIGLSKFVEVVVGAALGTELLRASFTLFVIFGSLAFSFFVGSASGFLPAYQASRLKPVDSLRYAK